MGLLNRLPKGTTAIGGGLLVNGLTAYAFITISSRDLGAETYTPVALLWALSFLLGLGFFLPLEQETARLVASRVGHGQGIGPVVKSAARLGGVLALAIVALAVVAGRWFTDSFFDGEFLLLLGLLLVVIGLGAAHLVKGTLAGLGRFGGYARYVIGEGIGRLTLVVIVLSMTTGAGAYGLAIGLAPFVGIAVAVAGQRQVFTPGPEAHMGDLSRALGSLLVASVCTALVLNVSPLAVEVLATDAEADEPGRFLNALLVARVPLFFFQAVQAALLPRLSGLAGQGRFDELWRELRRLLVLVLGLGATAVAVAAVAGPWAVEFAFGAEFAVGRRDVALLACSSAGLMVVLSLAQALIACGAQGRMALAWVAGVVAFPITVAFAGDELFLRVEVALIVTVSVAAAMMAVLVERRLVAEGVRPRLWG